MADSEEPLPKPRAGRVISLLPLRATFTLSIVSLFLTHFHTYPLVEGPSGKSVEAAFEGSENNETAYMELAHAPNIRPDMRGGYGFKAITPRKRKDPLPPDITRANTEGMRVALTFDGGGDADDADIILKTLKEKGVRATIFLTGRFIEKYPLLVLKMVEDGHEIGNHTANHPHLTEYGISSRHTTLANVTREFLAGELKVTERLFSGLTGKKMAPLWRAPYGEINGALRLWAYGEGYIHVGWTSDRRRRQSLDTLDWVADVSSKYYLTSAEIKEKILNFGGSAGGLKGGIILMHLSTDRHDRISERLPEIIDILKGRDYEFATVSELVEGDKRLRPFLDEAKAVAMGRDGGASPR